MAITRSENMRRIRSRDTVPELTVRRTLRTLGFTGYRVHRKDLPGKPDIIFIGKRKAILIHGCFWHGHNCKEGVRKPKSNREYWLPKIEGNQQRDKKNGLKLLELGWSALTIWECQTENPENLTKILEEFMKQ